MAANEGWTVRKVAGELRPDERFIFADDLGGEGEALTVVAVGADMFGTTEVEVEELDFTLDIGTNQMVTMATDKEEDEDG